MVRYDIPTLLGLSQNAYINIDQFSTQALGNNLLRQHKASLSILSEKPINRSREVSNPSRQSHEALPTTQGPCLHYPSRQPDNPPQETLAQIDAGFARFLKEHESPKHQRVTAGGRIVPMDPQTPVPNVKLPTNNPTIRSCEGAASRHVPQREGTSSTEDKRPNSMEKNPNFSELSRVSSLPSGILIDNARLSSINGKFNQQVPPSDFPPDLPAAALAPAMFLQSSLALPFGNQQAPQPGQPSQGSYAPVVMENATYGFGGPHTWLPTTYQTLNTQGIISPFLPPPIQQTQSASLPTSDFAAYSGITRAIPSTMGQCVSGLDSFFPNIEPQGHSFSGSQVPLLSQPPFFTGEHYQEALHRKSLNEATKEHETLSAQLSRLDRYTAMHTWDLDPRSKKLLVEQRMSLVRELDAVRVYKEQLELLLRGPKLSDSGNPNEAATDVQMSSGFYLYGNIANNQTLLGSRLGVSTSNYLGPPFPATSLANVFPPLISFNEPFNSALQWQGKENVDSYGNGFEIQDTSTGWESSTEYYDPTTNAILDSIKPGTQGKAPMEITAEENMGINDGWATPTKPAPPDIRRVYHGIEEAIRRGDPVDELLNELSGATARLAKRSSENCSGSPSSKRLDRQPSRSQCSFPAGSTKGLSNFSGLHMVPVRRTRRLWESENLQIFGKDPGDDQDEGKSLSSYTSTTDSWGAIHEGGKCWLHRESVKSEANGLNQESLREIKNQYPSTQADALVEMQASNVRGVNSWIHTSSDNQAEYTAHNATSKNHSSSLDAVSSLESMRQAHPQLLTQYFNKDRGLYSQKTAALAVSQNINAHAFLPPFDGSGDTPDLTSLVRDNLQDNVTQGQEKTLWYIRKEHIKPSPTVLREFFRRIEEEERLMIYKYHIAEPTPWRLS